MNCILTTVVIVSFKYFEFILFMLIAEVIVLFIVQFFSFYLEGCEHTLAFLGSTVVYWRKLPAKNELGEFYFAFCLKKASQNIIIAILPGN